MNIIRPLQLSFNRQVLEQDRRFFLVISAGLGVNLQTGEERLDVSYIEDVFAAMGDNPLPDPGMPKPNGEFLVSGSFYPPGGQTVHAGEVCVRLGEKEKNLYIFGPRRWKTGLPSSPEPVTSMPIDYTRAFGGKEYERNPEGTGFNDGLLPCIEDPARLVSSRRDKPDPAGFGPLYFMLPQRMKYQGTYDEEYKRKYFPGYPKDHDWRYFLCAPRDQWTEGYYQGNESFALYNMHPDIPVIKGSLPRLYARCFINRKKPDTEQFAELPLKLDTIWFFPDRLLALLIFRGVLEVEDDEAETITHVLAAYEDMSQQTRSLDYYRNALERRRSSNDELLTNLNTPDLIPEGHKSAMELLMGQAHDGGNDSEFDKNMQAKSESVQKMVDERIEEAVVRAENNMENVDVPGKEKPDIRKMMEQASEAGQDPDTKLLNDRLEAIMPGITAQDPVKLDMKNFSFDKVDEIFEAVDEFSDKKKKAGDETVKAEIEKARQQIKEQIQGIERQMDQTSMSTGSQSPGRIDTLEESRNRLKNRLEELEKIDPDETPKTVSPLPRVNAEEIKARTDQSDPRIMEAMQHVESLKAMGIEDQGTADLEKQIRKMFKDSTRDIDHGLQEAEKNFREVYVMNAHFMDEGAPPHNESLEIMRQGFLEALSAGEQLSGRDWACIDLSGQNLDGIDLSNAYLEQVNFCGASLRGAILKGAILARANLKDADCTGADMEGANVGAVYAHGTNFREAGLKSAKLSRGDFTRADFSRADLEDIELFEIIINEACFEQAHMPKTVFLEIPISGASFFKADMAECVFIKCSIKNTDFRQAVMKKCVFADTALNCICFDDADLPNACFAVTDPEFAAMDNLTFRAACLAKANFQNMELKTAVFSSANLENACFGGADLSGADLCRANAKSAQFRKARLTGAILDDINLAGGSLAKAHLTGASFKRANLYQADFLRSTITDTDFAGSNLDATLIEHWRPR